MENTNFLLTHFYRRPPDPSGWIQTVYVTRKEKEKDGIYYLALGSSVLNINKINEDVENGSLLELATEFAIKKGESVWIAPDQSVYIANTMNPSHGDITNIYQETILSPYDVMEAIVRKNIIGASSGYIDTSLESYLTYEYWKILLSILVKWLRDGAINDNNFVGFGYLFSKLEKMYKNDFTIFMNQQNMALSRGGLCYANNQGYFNRLEIVMLGDLKEYIPEADFNDEDVENLIPTFDELDLD